jgi:hypothetical protein
MTRKPTRIAMTDPSLLERLRKLRPGTEFLACDPGSLGGTEADFFLLDDETAIRFLGANSGDAWPSVVVVAEEGGSLPAAYREGLADDLLVLPARALDLDRLIRGQELLQALRRLEQGSHGMAGLVKRLREDISLAQKIQRRLIREKFPPLGPLSVKSKYWCGLKSGGDYFDLFDFPGGSHAGLILASSSSYALSTSLIGALMQFPLNTEERESSERIAQALLGKVRATMKEKERLSFFCGIFDRRAYSLRFVDCGGVFLAKRSKDGAVTWAAKGERPPFSPGNSLVPAAREVSLEPGERLLLCSEGWSEALEAPVPEVMGKFLQAGTGAQELMNELGFRLRRQLEKAGEESEEFPMPPQDCSVLVFDLAGNALRLAKGL